MSLPTAQTLEIEWDGVSFTDVTTYLEQRFPVEAHFGRMSATGDVESATLTFTLDNRDGSFTPGNPVSAYWPNVVKGKRVRWKVTGGDTTTRTEFIGYIQGFEPGFVDGGISGAVVTVTAADRFTVATRPMDDQGVEQARLDSAVAGKVFDAWPLTERSGSQSLRNVGTSSGAQAATVYWPGKDPNNGTLDGGAATLSTPDAGLLASASLVMQPASAVGPVLVCPISCPSVGSIQFWFRTTELPTSSTVLMQGFDSTGEMTFKLGLNPSGSSVNLGAYDASGTLLREFAGGVNDGEWRHVWLEASTSGNPGSHFVTWTEAKRNVYYSLLLSGAGGDITIEGTKTIVIGGAMRPHQPGTQKQCPTVEFAQVIVTEKTMDPDSFGYGKRGVATYARDTLTDRVPEVSGYGFSDTSVVTINGTSDPVLCPPDFAGNTVTQVLQEVARTVGGVAWVKPDGTVEFRCPDQIRPGTPDLTVDVEADADGTLSLAASVDTRPTRVTVSSPFGDVLVTSGAAQEVPESIDTCASSALQARNAGELVLAYGDSLRIPQVTVNLATATNSLWTSVYGLYPGARVRVSGLSTTVLGWSYADYYLQGWTKRTIASEDGASDGFWVDLDLEPAWTIAEVSTARTAAASGAMTATAGTISGTSTGTLVVTTGSGPALSNDAGDYPCDFDWNGERVTVTAAPASASSPQTLTVTARGVAPSVARTHGAGETFGVWDSGKVGI